MRPVILFGYMCIETITSTRDGYDDALRIRPDGLANIRQRLNQRIVGRVGPRPQGLQKFILGNQAAAVFHQVAKKLKRLGAQLDLVAVAGETAGRETKLEWTKSVRGSRLPAPIS